MSDIIAEANATKKYGVISFTNDITLYPATRDDTNAVTISDSNVYATQTHIKLIIELPNDRAMVIAIIRNIFFAISNLKFISLLPSVLNRS